MLSFQDNLVKLRRNLNQNRKTDFTFVHQLQKSFHQIKNTPNLISCQNDNACKLMNFTQDLYAISNQLYIHLKNRNYSHPIIFQNCFKLRVICCEIICMILLSKRKNEQLYETIVFPEIIDLAFQVLVITIRMSLDGGKKYIGFARNTNPFVKNILSFHGVSENKLIAFLNALNSLEIYRYQPQSNVDIRQVKVLINKLKSQSGQIFYQKYSKYIQWVFFQIVVKLLKKGVDIEQIKECLPQKQLNIVKALYLGEDFDFKILLSQIGVVNKYYNLYIEVKRNGFNKISDEQLMSLLSQQWTQKGFFEVLAQNYQISIKPLIIWFKLYNKSFKKSTPVWLFNNALKFFISLVDYTQSSNSTLLARSMTDLLIELVTSLLSFKKSTQFPINPILKSAIIIVRELVIYGQKQTKMSGLFQSLRSLIHTHSFKQLGKDLLAIEIFYLLSQNSPSVSSKFEQYKIACPQKSQLKEIITIACQSVCQQIFSERAINLIKQQPSFLFLFIKSKGLKKLFLLETSFLDQIQNIFEIFNQVISNQSDAESVIERLTLYVGNTSLKYNEKTQQQLTRLIQTIISKCKSQDIVIDAHYNYMLAAIFCLIFKFARQLECSDKFQKQTKYSKINKFLKTIVSDSDLTRDRLFLELIAAFFSALIPKLLIDDKNQKKPLFQQGQIVFYQLLEKVIQSQTHNLQPSFFNSFKLLMFQLRILNNEIDRLSKQVSNESNVLILNLFNSCSNMPKSLRLQLFRKMIYMSVCKGEKITISLNDFKTAIICCEKSQERAIFAKQIVCFYKDQGRMFLQSMSLKYPDLINSFDRNY